MPILTLPSEIAALWANTAVLLASKNATDAMKFFRIFSPPRDWPDRESVQIWRSALLKAAAPPLRSRNFLHEATGGLHL